MAMLNSQRVSLQFHYIMWNIVKLAESSIPSVQRDQGELATHTRSAFGASPAMKPPPIPAVSSGCLG